MIVYGQNPVEEILAVARDQIRRIVVDHDRRIEDLDIGDDIRCVIDPEELERLTNGGHHQGVAAELGDFQYANWEKLVGSVRDASTACFVVLDQVQDPHNLGAILRSAAALGVDGVLVPKDRSASVTDAVVRTSAGLAFRVPVCRVTNIARTLAELKEEGFWTVGTVMDGDTDLWDVDFKMKTALVLGGEGSGIRRLVQEGCDFKARIPMADGAESLNVSVAAAIAMYEIRRQLG